MVTDFRDPTYLTAAGNYMYFSAFSEGFGEELHRMDPATSFSANTVTLVTDLFAGDSGSAPVYITAAGATGDVFFSADDGISGRELWVTTLTSTLTSTSVTTGSSSTLGGVSGGAQLVADLSPGTSSSDPEWLTWHPTHNKLYFSASTSTYGRELYSATSTSSSAVLVYNLCPGPGDSNPSYIVAWGGSLYFSADNCAGGSTGLYAYDGVSPPVLIGGLGLEQSLVRPIQLTPATDGFLYFLAEDGLGNVGAAGPNADLKLWKTDGVTSQLALVRARDGESDMLKLGSFETGSAAGGSSVRGGGAVLLLTEAAVPLIVLGAIRDDVGVIDATREAKRLASAGVFTKSWDEALIVSDADGDKLTLVLHASRGTLEVVDSSSQDVIITSTDDTGKTSPSAIGSTLTLQGTATAINLAMRNLVYRPNTAENGWDTIDITVTDDPSLCGTDDVSIECKSYGGGVPLSATGSLRIHITAVNMGPTVTAPVSISARVDSEVYTTGTIRVSDPDIQETVYTSPLGRRTEGVLTVTVSALFGRVSVGSVPAVTYGGGGMGVGETFETSITISGGIDDVNAALAGFAYRCFQLEGCGRGDVVTDVITVSADDNGYTGTGGAQQDSALIVVTF